MKRRAAPPALLLAGFDARAAARLRRGLSGVARVVLARDAARAVKRLSRASADVLCLGPAIADQAARRLLDDIGRLPAAAGMWSVVLRAGRDLSLFQELVDADRVHWLARDLPSPGDVRRLLRRTLAQRRRLGPRAAEIDPGRAPLVRALPRRLALAESEPERTRLVEEAACEAAGAERARLLRHDAAHDVLVGLGADGDSHERRASAAVGLAAFVLRSGRGLCLERAGDDPRHESDADDPAGDGGERLLALPLRAGRRVTGVLLALRSRHGRPFDRDARRALGEVARAASAFVADGVTQGGADGPRTAPYRAAALAHHAGADTLMSGPDEEAEAAPRGLWAALRALRPEAVSAAWPWRRRRLRFVAQGTPVECGCACLAMVLGYHGRNVRLADIRAQAGLSHEPTSAAMLIETARRFGLRGRGVQVADLDDLRRLPAGSVLHWRFSHFVVLERLAAGGVFVLDPAGGRRFVDRRELDRAFTGVALTFEPAGDFAPGDGPRHGRLRRALGLLRPEGGLIARLFLASLALQALALAVPLATRAVVDRAVPRAEPGLLALLGAGALALGLFQLLVGLARGLLLVRLRARLDARLATGFVEHLVELPWLFFNRRSRGDLLMRLNSHAAIRDLLAGGTLGALLDGLAVVGSLALLVAAHPRFGALAATLGAARGALYLFTRRRYEELTARLLETQADANGHQVELLSGIETLKAAGAEPRAVLRWSQVFARQRRAATEHGRLDAAARALLDALATVSPLALLVYGAGLVLQGQLSLGTMLALLALAGAFLGPLSALVATAYQWQSAASYLERLDEVLDTPRETSGTRVPGRLRGRIELRELSFRYGRLAPPAVRDVSTVLEPGRFVAVVGRSGSGKSTLAALLSGLLRPDAGSVLYDGVDLAELDLRALRRQLGFVPQHPYLFAQSIRANLALTQPEATLAEITTAARLAAIHDEIAALPLGYDTPLSDGGASLSGGQRQRLALARALVGRPRVLVLDEATSALDGVTERRVFEGLGALDLTRVVIAHRISTVAGADLILVMDAGRLVAAGRHDDLLGRSPVYRELAEAQLGRELRLP